ncbi:hypothetical protein GH714_031051 [Hevea brasiliensis]|uniref:Uncharacterized protein n=1 Tax=Hevea brasiliensis TaxID=3981 RepID=A0A6A6NCV8_HEVBR|nr:hypothetical protein GH714_031051 [Hevea brasiliensis]
MSLRYRHLRQISVLLSRIFPGPDHCWLNRVEGEKDCFKEDGTFLVLAGQFFENSQIVLMIEKIKSLQRKYPELCVMGFHSGNSIGYAAVQAYLIELIMKEYITFPILLSNKNFLEMENGACYILFRDSRSPVIYHEKDLDLGMLNKGIEELNVQQIGNVDNENYSSYKLKSTWVKQAEGIKEPDFPTSLQNMLSTSQVEVSLAFCLALSCNCCISADESSDRLFLSDSNHHRIIILDGNGKIMDCIGSSPGFEDGEFESAKLLRPAGSFYHDAEDCLYIVDSEVIFDIRINMVNFVFIRSFETLWIMDLASGEIKECIKGFPKILETYGQLIMDKVSLLKQMPSDWLQRCINADSSPKVFPFASLISAVTTFHNLIVVCDTVAQRVLKLDRESGVCSNFQFSNFGILGFPYWASFHLERVFSEAPCRRGWTDHLQSFSSLPGRIDIRLNVDIPMDVELVEPLQKECIWRQARGAATEVLGRELPYGYSLWVHACRLAFAQQWYDDLDNLAFSTPEYEITGEDGNTTSDVKSEDGRVHIDCAIKQVLEQVRGDPDLYTDSRENYAARITDILNPGRITGIRRDACIQLLKSNADLRDLTFMKPLHVRIKLDCVDHPKAHNGKDIILTNSSLEVNVTL